MSHDDTAGIVNSLREREDRLSNLAAYEIERIARQLGRARELLEEVATWSHISYYRAKIRTFLDGREMKPKQMKPITEDEIEAIVKKVDVYRPNPKAKQDHFLVTIQLRDTYPGSEPTTAEQIFEILEYPFSRDDYIIDEVKVERIDES